MYNEFILKNVPIKIMGYHWSYEKPRGVVCIVHGIGEHGGKYTRMAEYLNSQGVAVLAMDLRGHGCSEGVRGHCAPRKNILKDIDDLIAYGQSQYIGIPIILYGHSMGGNLTLDYRRRGSLSHIPKGYIISAPWIILARPVSRAMVAGMKMITKIKPDLAINSGVKSELLGNPEMLKNQVRGKLAHNKITMETALEGYRVGITLSEGKLHGNDGGVGKPMLLMHGDADSICSVEGSRKLSKIEENCKYIEWPEYFHEIHNGNIEDDGFEVIKTIGEWALEIFK